MAEFLNFEDGALVDMNEIVAIEDVSALPSRAPCGRCGSINMQTDLNSRIQLRNGKSLQVRTSFADLADAIRAVTGNA